MFTLLFYGNIADGRRYQDSFAAFQWAEHDLDGKRASIFPQADKLNPGADLLCQRLGRAPGSVGDQPLREAIRNNLRHLLAQQLIPAIAKLLLRLGIQQDDIPALVHHHHSIRSCFQKSPVSDFHLYQMPFIIFARGDVEVHADEYGLAVQCH